MQFLEEHLSWGPERMTIQVQYQGPGVTLPDKDYQIEFKLSGNRNRVGRFPLLLIAKPEHGRPVRVPVMVQVEVTYDVLQARHPLKRGHILEEADVDWVSIRASRVLRNVATRLEDVVGYRMTRNLDQGETISPYMLKKVPLIQKGAQVVIVAEKGTLSVTAPGIAQQNGFKDGSLMVQNIQSGKTIVGTVMNSRTVRVDF